MTILVLRGHIRSSFNNNNLYNLVKTLSNTHSNLKIYIHTWNIVQNETSWRKMEQKNIPVNNELINWYFKDLSYLIKHIIIDDDNQIEITGRTEGAIIPKVKGPIIGWKRYWYGKYQIISYLHNIVEESNELIINCRFDVLENSNSYKTENIVDFINKNMDKKLTRNIFYTDTILNDAQKQELKQSIGKIDVGSMALFCVCNNFFIADTLIFYGIDNLYLGNIHTQYTLVNHFHKNLDTIIKNNMEAITQEFLVPIENNILFTT